MSVIIFTPGFELINGDDLNANFGLVLPVQRSVMAAQQAQIQPADFILNVNIGQSLVWQLPRSATRNGKPLIFVDAGLKFGTFPQTFQPFGTETFTNWQNPSSLVTTFNGQVLSINPFNDGVNTGWFLP